VTGMTPFFEFLLFALAVIVFVYLYRVVSGPTVFDRVLGLNGIATKAIIMLVAVGTVYQRVEMFVDISTGYALLNLVSALAVAKYLEGRGRA
jgi:multicomponent Na+:H+ antiporter subunit F